jgi:hypothetical protein
MYALTTKYANKKSRFWNVSKKIQAVNLTTDMDLTEGESYMTVTAHFITEAWGLQWLVLVTKQMQKNHTTVNIAQRLGEVADTYIIPGPKRVTMVHNAPNMILCADILAQEEEWADVK